MIRPLAAAGLIALSLGCTGSIRSGDGITAPSGGGNNPSAPGAGVAPGGGSPTAPGGGQPGGAPGGSPSAMCLDAAPVRLWRLTHNQLRNTVLDVFGVKAPVLDTLPDESRLDGFANASERLQLSPVLLAYYDRGADAVADEVVKRSTDFVKCPLEGLGQGTCLPDFLRTVGARAWRRPLTDVEVAKLSQLYTTAAASSTPADGFKTVVKGLFLSANFLYRTELGADSTPGKTTTLTDVELASALSYSFWDSPPDAALMELAVAGKLHQPDVLKAQARRMFAGGGKASSALYSFMKQWLETEKLTTDPKDTSVYPMFTPQVAADLAAETKMFIDGVVFDPAGDRSLKTLLTASYGYLDAGTAPFYGKTAGGAALARADLDPAQRKGLLTQASFLAAHADSVDTSVVGRGRYLREAILCAAVPPPPGDFKFDPKNITEDMTAREKLIEHSKNPACSSCHALFDSIGFALENYDAIGRYRTMDKAKVIDPSGKLVLPSGPEIHFKNFIDLIDQLAAGPDVYSCFASQYLTYLSGQVALDSCQRADIARTFATAGYRLDELALAIVTSPRFATRKN
jgi:hypothetical protein